jgi:hypothetical protein
MKVFQLSLLVVALFVGALMGAAQALAASGRPSDATLAAMGLADLRVMTDSEGLAVRGLGYNGASAYGKSFAVVASHGAIAGSTNGYKASGKYKASGHNISFAKVEVETESDHGGGNNGGYGNNSYGGGHGGKPQSFEIKAIAGGSSSGYRK